MTDNIESILAERKTQHGAFSHHARCSQKLKRVIQEELMLRAGRGQKPLTDQQLESLSMIEHKIARIIAGDPDHDDHWDDISGYAKIANREFK